MHRPNSRWIKPSRWAWRRAALTTDADAVRISKRAARVLQAQDVYTKMSPSWVADKIKTPILLIHGEADDNTGTFPIQSERLYAAIRGNEGTVRLLMLPNEAHGYRGKETMEHALFEEISWFDKYLK